MYGTRIGLLALALGAPTIAQARTWTVCSSGCDRTSILGAITAATTGDVVQINAANWSEAVSINKGITLQGQTPATVLTGPISVDVITVLGVTGVTIKDMQIAPPTSQDTYTYAYTAKERAIYVSNNAGVTISGVTVANVVGGTVAGTGIYANSGSNVTITGSVFSEIDMAADAYYANGAAIYANGATLNISGTTFSGNSVYVAYAQGGAIYATSSTINITDGSGPVVFTSNTGCYGGAISGYASALNVDGAIFAANGAYYGAGVYVSSGAGTSLTDNLMYSNYGYSYGGALYLNNSNALTIKRNRVCWNASYAGSAFNVGGTVPASTISNNLIVGNQSFYYGATYVNAAGPIERNNLYYGNYLQYAAYGGGASMTTVDHTYTNNVFLANQAALKLYTPDTAFPVNYNDWYGNSTYDAAWSGGAYSLDLTNDVGADPKLLPRVLGTQLSAACDWNFYVQYNGPLRNDGNPSYFDADGTTSDIGPYGGPDADPSWWADADGDGYRWVYDCNDANAAIRPNLASDTTCNGIDDDCDGVADEDNATSRSYRDADADGFGDPAVFVVGCATGYVANNTDCNDANVAINPSADEVCDPSNVDENCNGLADDADSGAKGRFAFYIDTDHDNYGSTTVTSRCDVAVGYSSNSTDCDDAVAAINPGAAEVCDASNTDEDCDTLRDDSDPSVSAATKSAFYSDADGDGYGAGAASLRCDPLSGQVSDNTDCNDSSAIAHPGGSEVCDAANVDEDCDTLVDDADSSTSVASKSTFYVDSDGDGYGAATTALRCDLATGFASVSGDCNDTNATIRPGAQEVCDTGNADEDCDGLADDADSSTAAAGKTTFYRDADGDGFGTSATTQTRCDAGGGYVASSTDCNDSVPAVNPSAQEVCDAVDTDEDCDGLRDDADPSIVGVPFWYFDGDIDGYGLDSAYVPDCEDPGILYVGQAGDCDDFIPDVHPGALELCDNTDRNCDGQIGAVDSDSDGTAGCAGDCDDQDAGIYPAAAEDCDGTDNNCSGDELDASDVVEWYRDADHDAAGDVTAFSFACPTDPPAGYVDNPNDCDDASAAIGPTIPEVCDGVDQDCDAVIDDGVRFTYYRDADADAYGAAAQSTTGCTPPSGYVSNATDCDDTQNAVHPGVAEVCNGRDDDCDGTVDQGVSTRYYADADGDTYGDGAQSTLACSQPSGFVTSSTDCDDALAAIHPGAAEVCDGVDQDCDGSVDEYATDRVLFFGDADGDGHGTAASSVFACDPPVGFADNQDDCDDTDSNVYPGAPELCDAADDDCDGLVDEGVVPIPWYRDNDADGYGDDGTTVESCAPPSGYARDGGDCDESDATVHPGADEDCSAVDRDCDGDPFGPNPTDAHQWFADGDGDGFGAGGSLGTTCVAPSGAVENTGDCDDADAGIHPGAPEHCDGVDEDCDGDDTDYVTTFTFYADLDRDGFGDPSGLTAGGCSAPSGFAESPTDCDDTSAATNPAADERCNGVDDDCDGSADDDAVDATVWYADGDGDGLGDPNSGQRVCIQPSGTVANGNDCDDVDATVGSSPLWYSDGDLDGFGDDALTITACTAPSGYVDRGGDCDDLRADTNPTALEICDRLDQDCDGLVDDGAADAPIWYIDVDNDGFGVPTASTTACDRPAGYAATIGDCDDAAANVSPAAPEQCNNGADDDCDGSVDEDSVDTEWYADADGDGYGDANATPIVACSAPDDTVANALDCVDDDPTVNPNALELCNGIDEDCDGGVDEDASDGATWYFDQDADGWGDPLAPLIACERPADTVAEAFRGDCDDDDAATHPSAPEACDVVDNDCDGSIDEDVGEPWYADLDGDGWGDASDVEVACFDPEDGRVSAGGDCDDSRFDTHPDADETPYDGVDQDCDEGDLCDVDRDGFDAQIGTCAGDDCDDDVASVHPGASDAAGDGLDQDCDGLDGVSGTDREYVPSADTGDTAPKGCACDAAGRFSLGWVAALAAAVTRRRKRA